MAAKVVVHSTVAFRSPLTPSRALAAFAFCQPGSRYHVSYGVIPHEAVGRRLPSQPSDSKPLPLPSFSSLSVDTCTPPKTPTSASAARSARPRLHKQDEILCEDIARLATRELDIAASAQIRKLVRIRKTATRLQDARVHVQTCEAGVRVEQIARADTGNVQRAVKLLAMSSEPQLQVLAETCTRYLKSGVPQMRMRMAPTTARTRLRSPPASPDRRCKIAPV